jgi:hypothetical protein
MIDPSALLPTLPVGLRTALVDCFQEITSNFSQRRWEPSELNGGKFCEAVYSILHGAITGQYADKPSKPRDMATALRALESFKADTNRIGDESLRILIPKMLLPLYEVRNKRGVGHLGGDVDPNLIDATVVYGVAGWVLAELIRIFHGVTIQQAQDCADAAVERRLPLIWEVGKVRRVLETALEAKDQVLVLLYGKAGGLSDSELRECIEYRSASLFRTRVLKPLHGARFIEYQKESVRISPLGIGDVEKRILNPRKI